MNSCCRASVVGCLLLCGALWAAEPGSDTTRSWSEIDRHALKAPPEAEQSLAKLAKYLSRPCRTDGDKARVIYRWITDRIAYDVETFLSGKEGKHKAEQVLENRKAVCEGYANLFVDLGKRMDLKVVKVSGYGKGVGYVPGTRFTRTNHAWNMVEIGGKSQLIDSTWGAGYVAGKEFKKVFSDFYFLTPPEHLIFSHFPEKQKAQLLDPPLTLQQFEQQPFVRRAIFGIGVSDKRVRQTLARKGFREFVEAFTYPDFKVQAIDLPLDRHLKAGDTYRFEIKSGDCVTIAAYNGRRKTSFTKKGNVFTASVKVHKGEVLIAATVKDAKKGIRTFLQYEVE